MKLQQTSQDYIYKYSTVNEFLFRLLINNELYFTNPMNFNDPFDSNFIIEDNLTDQGKKEGSNERFEKETKDIKEKIWNMIGITCFSEEEDNFLMWSHYANGHRGICLKFDWTEDVETFQGFKVKYKEDLPVISKDKKAPTKNDLNKIFYNKLNHWEYENEIRSIQIIKEGNRVHPFNPKALKAVYLGAKISSADAEIIRKIIKSHSEYTNVNVIPMHYYHKKSKSLVLV